MRLLLKFNLIFALVFALGLIGCGWLSRDLLQRNAKEEILEHARLLMEKATAVRNYTTSQIQPLLATQMKYSFLPQSVPAYAATEVLHELARKYPEYGYKEATLNPTNPRDKAVAWEEDIVNRCRRKSCRASAIRPPGACCSSPGRCASRILLAWCATAQLTPRPSRCSTAMARPMASAGT